MRWSSRARRRTDLRVQSQQPDGRGAPGGRGREVHPPREGDVSFDRHPRDKAYIDYAHDPAIKTVAPVAMELPGVFITRSFSKAHGMAGLRLGYAIGQQETVQAIPRAWQLGSINTLTATAGIASLRDTQHIAEEVAENARVRDFTRQALAAMGYPALDSHANCVFVDVKRSAAQFREACAAMKVQVGRDFPPYEKTHARITLGTMDEMRQAVDVFRRVLTMRATSSSAQ